MVLVCHENPKGSPSKLKVRYSNDTMTSTINATTTTSTNNDISQNDNVNRKCIGGLYCDDPGLGKTITHLH